MILNVKKSNFIIYAACLGIGLALIAASIVIFYKSNASFFDELLLSIGCSTIPTVITAYLIDQASEKRNIKRIKELRNHFLWGAPHGFLWIMKTIIEFYSPDSNSDCISFYALFKKSVVFMQNKKFDDNDFLAQSNEIKSLLASYNLGYGIELCQRDCKSIIDHNYELEINGIFTKEELLVVSYLFEECEKIQNSYRLCEMAEVIDILVDSVIKTFTEIEEKANRIVKFENKHIFNWAEISL